MIEKRQNLRQARKMLVEDESNSYEKSKTYLKNLSQDFNDFNFLGKEFVLEELIKLGKSIPSTHQEVNPKYLVKGCQSLVSLKVNKENDKLFWKTSSDSLMMKGFLVILIKALNGLTCEETSQVFPLIIEFLKESSIPNSLTPSRSMGLSHIINFAKEIQEKEC